jgi:hypothetical protein
MKMSAYLRKLRGVIGIGLIWAPIWIVLSVVTIGSLIGIIALFNPRVGGSDVEPFKWIAVMGWIGFISGGIFAIFLSLAEHGKALRTISMRRAALWGLLGSAVFPLLTQRADQVFWTCPFGAVIAMALLDIARKAELGEADPSRRLRNVFFAWVLMSIRDVVDPVAEPASEGGSP